MKKPMTFEQQLDILLNRGLIIENTNECLEILRSINYYRLSAYLLPFKLKNNSYKDGTSLVKIKKIYEFDCKLRLLILSAIEEIELYLRTQFAYHFAHTYGTLGYLNPNNFSCRHNHEKFVNSISAVIKSNRSSPVVKHHIKEYEGKFPVWVIVEFFSIGNLSYFYADWAVADKKKLAKLLYETTYPFLDSWLKCLTVLRNRCAHYSRLYYANFTDMPRVSSTVNYKCTRRAFDQLMVLKFLHPHNDKWNKVFCAPLASLVSEYRTSINLEHIGFPKDWMDILSNT